MTDPKRGTGCTQHFAQLAFTRPQPVGQMVTVPVSGHDEPKLKAA